MQFMSIVLNRMENFAVAYIDDISVFSKIPEEHFVPLRQVYNRVPEHGLKIKLTKKKTKYLGLL